MKTLPTSVLRLLSLVLVKPGALRRVRAAWMAVLCLAVSSAALTARAFTSTLRTPGRDFTTSIKVLRTPTALRVGPGGKIEDVQVGVVDSIKAGEMFRPIP